MKRLFGKIFAIFFLAGLFCPLSLRSALPLVPGLILHDDVSGEDAKYLQKLLRQLDRYARRADIKRNSGEFIIVCGKGEYCGYSGKEHIYLPGDASLWRYDFELRRKIIGVLASHRFDFRYKSSSSGVAAWIVNGIDAELAEAERSGQYLVANRRYFFWSEVAGLSGKLPDFAATARLGRVKNPGMNAILAETSRVLLHILAGDKKIGKVFETCVSGGAPDAFIHLYGRNRAAAQERLNTLGMPVIWNRYSPMPGELFLARLAELENRFVPQLDEKGKPNGNYISCSLKEFDEYLSKKRTGTDAVTAAVAAETLRSAAAADFLQFSRMIPAEEQHYCSRIAKNILDFGKKRNAYAEFEKSYNALKARIRKRIKCDIFLKDVMAKQGALPDRYQLIFDTLKFSDEACSKDELKFLHRILNTYLQ